MMSYKKLVSLFAVSALALGACGADDTEEPDADEDTEQTDEGEESSSSEDLIDQAKDQTGEAFPEYGLEVVGEWTVDGYQVPFQEGEAATIPVEISSEEEEFNVYLVEDGAIVDVVSDEPEVEFEVESPAEGDEYLVGVTDEDLGDEGDEVEEDDFYRSEEVVLVEGAEDEEEEE